MGKRKVVSLEQYTEECRLARARSYEQAKVRRERLRSGDLPYSFSYKMRNSFYGTECPLCGRKMNKKNPPSIQHNVAVSKGGRNDLDNISVICRSCNSSIGIKETGAINNDLVRKKWEEINGC